MSNSLRPHGLQHARAPCPSPTARVCSTSCPSSRGCHPVISSSVIPFSSCPTSLTAPITQRESCVWGHWTSGLPSCRSSPSSPSKLFWMWSWFYQQERNHLSHHRDVATSPSGSQPKAQLPIKKRITFSHILLENPQGMEAWQRSLAQQESHAHICTNQHTKRTMSLHLSCSSIISLEKSPLKLSLQEYLSFTALIWTPLMHACVIIWLVSVSPIKQKLYKGRNCIAFLSLYP